MQKLSALIEQIYSRAFGVVEKLQGRCSELPIISKLSDVDTSLLLTISAALCLAIVVLILVLLPVMIHKAKIKRCKKKLRTFFNINDFQGFKVSKVGNSRDKYFRCDNGNYLKLNLPYWKRPQSDDPAKKTRRGPIVRPQSILWLSAGKNTYVMRSKDPLDMLFLVHFLRDNGVNIPPCQQEIEKREQMKEKKRNTEDIIRNVYEAMEGNEALFVELCRERLSLKGCNVLVVENALGIDFFAKGKNAAYAVKCFLTARNTLTGMEALKTFYQLVRKTYSHSCMFITTGKVTYAAAQFANSNGIKIICNDDLVALLDKAPAPVPGQEYKSWELTPDDLTLLVQEGISLRK